MHFKFDWASIIVGSKFIVFALCYFVFEGNFPSTSPRGDYIWRVFCVTGLRGLYLEGLIHGGAHFRNFTVYPETRRIMHISEAVIHQPLADNILLYLHNSLQHTQPRLITVEFFKKAC